MFDFIKNKNKTINLSFKPSMTMVVKTKVADPLLYLEQSKYFPS